MYSEITGESIREVPPIPSEWWGWQRWTTKKGTFVWRVVGQYAYSRFKLPKKSRRDFEWMLKNFVWPHLAVLRWGEEVFFATSAAKIVDKIALLDELANHMEIRMDEWVQDFLTGLAFCAVANRQAIIQEAWFKNANGRSKTRWLNIETVEPPEEDADGNEERTFVYLDLVRVEDFENDGAFVCTWTPPWRIIQFIDEVKTALHAKMIDLNAAVFPRKDEGAYVFIFKIVDDEDAPVIDYEAECSRRNPVFRLNPVRVRCTTGVGGCLLVNHHDPYVLEDQIEYYLWSQKLDEAERDQSFKEEL